MPAKSEKQRKFMGAELGRLRAGEKTKTGMSEQQLSEFASKSLDKPIKHKLPTGEEKKIMQGDKDNWRIIKNNISKALNMLEEI